jgi:hypothetical protein
MKQQMTQKMKINTIATAKTAVICLIVKERLTRKITLQRYTSAGQ